MGWTDSAAVAFLTLAPFVVGCGSDNSGSGSTDRGGEGTLPCTKTPVECRLAFEGDYDGTISGSDSGTFAMDVNLLGGVSGTASGGHFGGSDLSGQVSEFGEIHFSLSDGTLFDGQYAADHSFKGTWKGPAGSGAFQGRPESATDPTDGGATTSPDSGTGQPPSVATVLAAASAACEKLKGCGATAECSPAASMGEEGLLPVECRTQELSLYQCIAKAGCAAKAECKATSDDAMACLLGGSATDPGTVYEPTGNKTYDQAIAVCDSCKAEAKACHDLPDCYAYAVCADACDLAVDEYCVEHCSNDHPTGRSAWFGAMWCDTGTCP